MVVGLFTDAEGYLERKAAVGRVYKPAVIVFVLAVSLTLQPLGVYLALTPTEMSWVADLVTVLWIGYFVWGFVLWGLFTAVLYVLSSLVGGKPLLGHLTRVVGWGMLPMVFSGAVWGAGNYVVSRGRSLAEPPYPGIEHEHTVFVEFTAGLTGDPAYVGTTALGCAFVALSGYLWGAGLVTASDISRRKANLVAGATVLVFVAWKLTTAI